MPDALLRARVSRPTPQDEIPSADVVTHPSTIITINNISSEEDYSRHSADRALQDLRTISCTDLSYISLLEAITSGFLPTGTSYLLPSFHTGQYETASMQIGNLSCTANGSWFLLPFDAAPSLACMTATEVWKLRSVGQDIQFSGLASIISNFKKTVSACKPCQMLQPSQQQEHLMCNYKPTRPFKIFSVSQGNPSSSMLTDSRGGQLLSHVK
ncbi:hypothetical protein SK128_007861, partial [Halocaridina rubra]